jgi:hypothetical protein
MFSPTYKTRLTTALAGAALASALAVSGASADPHTIDAYNRTANPPQVAPPPSLMAASAAEAYQDLRSPDAVDAAGHRGLYAENPRAVSGPGPYTDAERRLVESPRVQALVRSASQEIRETPAVVAVDQPSDGFDWMSAAIGAIAAGGLSLLLIATLGLRRRPAGRAASA